MCDLACDRDVVVEEKTVEVWFYSPCDVVQTVCMNRILHEKMAPSIEMRLLSDELS